MAKNYKFWCEKEGHLIDVRLVASRVDSFIKQCDKLKKVCPECKPTNVRLIRLHEGFKIYRCSNNHLNSVGLFKDGMCHVSCDDNHQNYLETKGTHAEELVPVMIDNGGIVCQYQDCGAKLVPEDDTLLTRPHTLLFKTKTRVGDIWERNGVPDSKTGSYDGDGWYHETEFERRNRDRLKNMQRTRNISRDSSPGTPIDSPTDPNE